MTPIGNIIRDHTDFLNNVSPNHPRFLRLFTNQISIHTCFLDSFFMKKNLIPTTLLIIQNDINLEKLHLHLLLAALHQIINNKLTADVYAINTFLAKTRREWWINEYVFEWIVIEKEERICCDKERVFCLLMIICYWLIDTPPEYSLTLNISIHLDKLLKHELLI